MNSDIIIMIELQGYWDKILKAGSDIERSRKSIRHWEEDLKKLKNDIAGLEDRIKGSRNNLKARELVLKETEEKVASLKKRKNEVQSDRELKAVEKELSTCGGTAGSLEEEVLQLMEELESEEGRLEELTGELPEKEKQVAADLELLKGKIADKEREIAEAEEQFEKRIPDLSSSHQTRFRKLLDSKDGTAVAEVTGEICGHCNFQIPPSDAIKASRDDSVSVCTNCGRFIFKKNQSSIV